MRTIIETFTAGVPKTFCIPAARIEIMDAAYPIDVSLQNAIGVEITNGKAASVEAGSYLAPEGGFDQFTITSPVTQSVKFIVAYGDSGTRRMAGVVQVVDGGKARTIAQVCFMAYVAQSGIAATYAHTQLWNPVGSGKRVVLESISSGNAAAFSLFLKQATTPLGATYATLPANKKFGGAAPAAETRCSSSGAIFAGQVLYANDFAAGTFFKYDPKEPVVIEPGLGVVAVNSVVGGGLNANFEWYEESM